MHRLDNDAPRAAQVFDINSLKTVYTKYNGSDCSWVEFMHDRNITKRHVVNDVILNNWRSPSEGGGRWRLLYSLADYAEP